MSDLRSELLPTSDPRTYRFPITLAHCAGPKGNQFLFGGLAFGSCLAAMEAVCGLPIIWASAQFLSFARAGEELQFEVQTPVIGNFVTQARVVARIGNREVLTVQAALGRRERRCETSWLRAPKVPQPDDCPVIDFPYPAGEKTDLELEFRAIKGRIGPLSGEPVSGDNELLFWARSTTCQLDSRTLAVLGDFVPTGITNAIGLKAGGNSLDNSIRIYSIPATNWVLCQVAMHALIGGFAHGDMRLFSEDGELMATASQSCIVRFKE